MSKPPVFDLSGFDLVRVRLSDLYASGDNGFPDVTKLPSASKDPNHLIGLIVATQTPVVTPAEANGMRRVLANVATVALLRALLPQSERRDFNLRCWEWKTAPADFLPIVAPHAVLGLMVNQPKAPPTRELLRSLKERHGLSLRRRKPRAVDELAPSKRDKPQ